MRSFSALISRDAASGVLRGSPHERTFVETLGKGLSHREGIPRLDTNRGLPGRLAGSVLPPWVRETRPSRRKIARLVQLHLALAGIVYPARHGTHPEGDSGLLPAQTLRSFVFCYSPASIQALLPARRHCISPA